MHRKPGRGYRAHPGDWQTGRQWLYADEQVEYGPREGLPRNICDAGQQDITKFVRDQITSRVGKTSRAQKFPRNLAGRFTVDGHRFVVVPSTGTGGRKVSKHRVFYEAKDGTLIPTGRINQSKMCGGRGGRMRSRR